MNDIVRGLRAYYAVLFQPQSYLNLAYLLFAFPLGIFYFVFLVTGISVGLATAILWVGLAILLVTGGAWYLLAGFERWMLTTVLRWRPANDTPAPSHEAAPAARARLGDRFRDHLRNQTTWTSLVYLLSKFPLGIVSFVALVTSLSLTTALVLAPLAYAWSDPRIGSWAMASWSAAWLVSMLGLFVIFPASLHLMNGLARVSGWWARQLLGAA